jgi:hypothetical protein
MQHHEFRIGGLFWTAMGQFKCTDVGSRTIVAGGYGTPESRLDGPPYKFNELVFNERDIAGCYPSVAERNAASLQDLADVSAAFTDPVG